MNAAPYNLSLLSSKDATEKFTEQRKVLRVLKEQPETAYDDLDFFVKLMDDKNSILSWTGILAVGYLAKVDAADKIEPLLPKLYTKLNSGRMITAGNTLKALTEIAEAKPARADEIVKHMTKVWGYEYQTDECLRILKGLSFVLFERLWPLVGSATQNNLLKLAKAEQHNTRSTTAKKAQRFLQKHS